MPTSASDYPPWAVEARTAQPFRASPWSIIEHPFRVLILDQENNLLVEATVGLGSCDDPLSHVRTLFDLHIEQSNAWCVVCLERVDPSSIHVYTAEQRHAVPTPT